MEDVEPEGHSFDVEMMPRLACTRKHTGAEKWQQVFWTDEKYLALTQVSLSSEGVENERLQATVKHAGSSSQVCAAAFPFGNGNGDVVRISGLTSAG